MTRRTLSNLTSHFSWTLFAFALSGAFAPLPASAGSSTKMRVDCRYFSGSHFCYSSAKYRVMNNGEIDRIRFGVGCDYETIYDDGGTNNPQDEVADSLRPYTAALPRVELTPKGSLAHPGTYTSKLETEHGRMTDGTCYVREVDDDEEDYNVLMQAAFYLQ